MAQSAGKLAARKSRSKQRKINRDEHGQYVNVYVQNRLAPIKVYKWMFDDRNQQERIPGTWDDAKKIGNLGLAKRSWMWGLQRFGKGFAQISAPIPGTSRVAIIREANLNGYIKENKLHYITKALPRGWERMVERAATRRIMGTARNKLERKYRREMGMAKWKRGMAHVGTDVLAKYFMRGAA